MGFHMGVGTLRAQVSNSGYSAAITVKLGGLARLVSDGRGAATANGAFTAGRPVPARYAISTMAGDYAQSVRMALVGGAVRLLAVEPTPRYRPDVVPVLATHKRGIVDPVSALIMPYPGTGDLVTASACRRTLPVFDGRARYDVILSYDRMEQVEGDHGSYAGPVVVCRAAYRAIAGHRENREQVKFLEDNHDMEVWLAPVAGTRSLIPWKISVRTMTGTAVIEAQSLVIQEGVRQARADTVRDLGLRPRKD
jgi:hypothetical protein